MESSDRLCIPSMLMALLSRRQAGDPLWRRLRWDSLVTVIKLSRSDGNFLYRNVSSELRRRIVGSVYSRGSAIPSQAALVAEFAVSPITIRRAVRELMVEGWLYGQQGLGIFVADRRRVVRVLSGELTRSFGDEIRRAGLT